MDWTEELIGVAAYCAVRQAAFECGIPLAEVAECLGAAEDDLVGLRVSEQVCTILDRWCVSEQVCTILDRWNVPVPPSFKADA